MLASSAAAVESIVGRYYEMVVRHVTSTSSPCSADCCRAEHLCLELWCVGEPTSRLDVVGTANVRMSARPMVPTGPLPEQSTIVQLRHESIIINNLTSEYSVLSGEYNQYQITTICIIAINDQDTQLPRFVVRIWTL